MLTRFNKILIGLLALQVLIALLVVSGGDDGGPVTEQPLLPGFDAAAVTRVQVFESAKDKPVDLVKRGDAWVLASHHDYPADPSKVTDALAPVAKLAAAEPVATSASRHKQLRVGDADFDRKVILTAGGQDTILYIGGSAGLRRNALRLGSDERVWGVAGLSASTFGGKARDWVAASYYETPRAEITKLVVERGGSTVTLEKPAPPAPAAGSGSAAPVPAPATSASWTLAIDGQPVTLAEGEELDTFAIDTVISNVARIAAEPTDPKRDTAKPTATITVHRKGGSDVFDVIASGEYYWVKQRGLEHATLVDKDRFEAVMDVKRDKLVKQEPETDQPTIAPAVPAPAVPAPN